MTTTTRRTAAFGAAALGLALLAAPAPARHEPVPLRAIAASVVAAFDADADGFVELPPAGIDPDALAASEVASGDPPRSFLAQFRAADRDGDGSVGAPEYRRWLKGFDRDADGGLDVAEQKARLRQFPGEAIPGYDWPTPPLPPTPTARR